MRRFLCVAIIARSARFLINRPHYHTTGSGAFLGFLFVFRNKINFLSWLPRFNEKLLITEGENGSEKLPALRR
jgi:hypothetical protein